MRLLALLLLAGCGAGESRPPGAVVEGGQRTAVSSQLAARSKPDDPRVVCPVGTTQREDEGFGLRTVWCVDSEDRHHGPERSWWSNGQIAAEMIYVHGNADGPSRGWYEDGAREFERSYRAGKLHGKALAWHANGKKAAESNWSEGALVGVAKRWDDKGRPEPVKEK
jgi:hypothetical protein